MDDNNWMPIAREGRTIDDREIKGEDIEHMASVYHKQKYLARIWLEHFRGIFHDGPFKAYGDVLKLRSVIDDTGKRVLEAVLNIHDELKAAHNNGQKRFWSIEFKPFHEEFKGPMLVGLAATDSPASLGTRAFSNQPGNLMDKIKIGESVAMADENSTSTESLVQALAARFRGKRPTSANVSGDASISADIGTTPNNNLTAQDVTEDQKADLTVIQNDIAEMKTQLSAILASQQKVEITDVESNTSTELTTQFNELKTQVETLTAAFNEAISVAEETISVESHGSGENAGQTDC